MNDWKALAHEIQKDSIKNSMKSGYEKDKADYLLKQRKASDKAKKERHYRELQKKLGKKFAEERNQRIRATAHRVSAPIMKVGGFLGGRIKSEWKHRKKMRRRKMHRHESFLKPMHPLGSM